MDYIQREGQPWEAVAVLAAAYVQSVMLFTLKPMTRDKGFVADRELLSSWLVTPKQLGAGRLAVGLYGILVFALEIHNLGVDILKFYTVWNWIALTTYFLLAGTRGVLATQNDAFNTTTESNPPRTDNGHHKYSVNGKQLRVSGKHERQAPDKLTNLNLLQIWLLHNNLTTVVIVDLVLWFVLVPMLKKLPAEEWAFHETRIYTFTSYNTHIANFFIIWADALIGCTPFQPYLVGLVVAWSGNYLVFAILYFLKYGQWLYMFLDWSKPESPLFYFGLYAFHYIAFGTAVVMPFLRTRLACSCGRGSALQDATLSKNLAKNKKK